MKLYKHVTDGGAEYLTTVENDLSTTIARLDGEPEAFGLLESAAALQSAADELAEVSKQIVLAVDIEKARIPPDIYAGALAALARYQEAKK